MAPGLLDSILNGVDGNGPTNTPNTPGQGGGLLPSLGLPSLSLGLPSLGLPTLGLPTPSQPSLPLTPSASSTTPSASSTTPSATSSPPTTSATPPPPTPPAPTNPTSAPDNAVQTVTNTNIVTGSVPAQTPTGSGASHASSFLQNKAAAGVVFALVGLVGLVLIIVGATCCVRRRNRRRLLDDAISFDPSPLEHYEGASEKGHRSRPSEGTIGSRPYGVPFGTSAQPEYYAPQPEYYPAQQQQQQQQQQQSYQDAGYYGQQQQQPQQQTYAYNAPMAGAPVVLSTLAGTSWTPAPAPAAAPQQSQHNIPRVPVPPVADPLPDEFGSSAQDNRNSVDEAAFWANMLTVRNE